VVFSGHSSFLHIWFDYNFNLSFLWGSFFFLSCDFNCFLKCYRNFFSEEKEIPSEKTEVEIVVKPDVEETKPSEVPTEEIPVTFEETVEITTEEKEIPFLQ
jgi:hypothetical protein